MEKKTSATFCWNLGVLMCSDLSTCQVQANDQNYSHIRGFIARHHAAFSILLIGKAHKHIQRKLRLSEKCDLSLTQFFL